MAEVLLQVHSYFRWVVLLAAIAAIIFALMSAIGSRPWDGISERTGLIFSIFMDIQLLVGAVLWIVQQRWTSVGFNSVVHPLAMIAALALVHVGRRRIDAATRDRAKGTQALIFFAASLVLMLAFIPVAGWRF
jgi:hypothetical protein